jgi:hypothetical protein
MIFFIFGWLSLKKSLPYLQEFATARSQILFSCVLLVEYTTCLYYSAIFITVQFSL